MVVGGGPTGVEFAAELQDYYKNGLKDRYPEIMDAFQITLIEALPNVSLTSLFLKIRWSG